MRSSNTCHDRLFQCWRLLLWLGAGLAVVCLPRPAWGIDPNRTMSQYVRERWAPENGFPRGPVYAINQTSDGYLWIGTETGLVRFDGLSFNLVESTMSEFPVVRHVLGLSVDEAGHLWVRLRRPTLLSWHDGGFEDPIAALGRPESTVSAMSTAPDGALLLWLLHGEPSAVVLRGGKLQTLAEPAHFSRSPVLALAQTPDGDLWVGTRDAGLFRIHAGHTYAVTQGLPDPKVNALVATKTNEVWVGTDRGVVRWDGGTLKPAGSSDELAGVQALAMTLDRDGNLWIGTNSRGLARLNTQGLTWLDDPGAGPKAAITALFEDREGILWIGSGGGLEQLRDSTFVTYSLPEGLPTDGNKPVFVDDSNRMWFPPVTGGLWWTKGGRHGRVTDDGLDRDLVYSIAGRDGDLWLGRQRGGLTRLHFEGGQAISRTFTEADGLAQNSVFSVYPARDGSVWAGTLSGGVSRLRGGTFTNYTVADGLLSNTVNSMLEASDGTIWLATPRGLNALIQGHWRAYTAGSGLPSDEVNCILEDASGVLWFGTAGGIAFRESSHLRVPKNTPASLAESILGIEEDGFGSLWLSTATHVLRVNREKLLRGTLAEGDMREYGLADGLRGVEGVKRDRSVVAGPDRRIWISLNRGISVVDPARLTNSSVPATPQLRSVLADGRQLSLRGAVHIPGGTRRISFTFNGLNLSFPNRVRFRYLLEGFDSTWSEPIAAREAVYTNLAPRRYRFRLRTSNPDGIWSSEDATVAFEVDPLFWETWWFVLSGTTLCALAILVLYRFRMRQMRRRLNLIFDERLAERTRIARDLHDTLLQSFQGTLLKLYGVTYMLPDHPEAKRKLENCLEQARDAITEGRDAVQGLRSSTVLSNDLARAISVFGGELAGDQPEQTCPEFRVHAEGKSRDLPPLVRDEVYKIACECLRNAFRHAQAKRIEVQICYDQRRFRLHIVDNGNGIDPAVLKAGGRAGHHGLPGIRERAQLAGGKLSVLSQLNSGTKIELRIPASIAYTKSPPEQVVPTGKNGMG